MKKIISVRVYSVDVKKTNKKYKKNPTSSVYAWTTAVPIPISVEDGYDIWASLNSPMHSTKKQNKKEIIIIIIGKIIPKLPL